MYAAVVEEVATKRHKKAQRLRVQLSCALCVLLAITKTSYWEIKKTSQAQRPTELPRVSLTFAR